MYGVVLWSDDAENKAVFWCEDHGDLAFFHGTEDTAAMAFDAGDLVEFDVYIDCKLRRARNACVVHQAMSPDLPRTLLTYTTPEKRVTGIGNVIPFQARCQQDACPRVRGQA